MCGGEVSDAKGQKICNDYLEKIQSLAAGVNTKGGEAEILRLTKQFIPDYKAAEGPDKLDGVVKSMDLIGTPGKV